MKIDFRISRILHQRHAKRLEGRFGRVGVEGSATFVEPIVGRPIEPFIRLIVRLFGDRERGSVQSCLFWLLAMILVWMIGMVAGEHEEVPRSVAALLLIPPSCFMAPLFLLLMLLYSRVEVFERRRGPRWSS